MGYYAAAYGHQAMMVGFGGMYGGYPFYAPGYGGASYVPYAYPTYVGANGAGKTS